MDPLRLPLPSFGRSGALSLFSLPRTPLPAPAARSCLPELLEMFCLLDLDCDGRISRADLAGALLALHGGQEAEGEGEAGMPVEAMAAAMFCQADANEDGFLDFEEFAIAAGEAGAGACSNRCDGVELCGRSCPEAVGLGACGHCGGWQGELRRAFALLDEDGDGLLTAEDLHCVIGRLWGAGDASLEECRAIVAQADRDGDGCVGFEEFAAVMEGQTAASTNGTKQEERSDCKRSGWRDMLGLPFLWMTQ